MRLRSKLRREEGTALVEFALVLPLLLLLLMGIIYYGRYISYANDENQLASSAARWASINSDPGGSSTSLQKYVSNQAAPELSSGSGDVSPVQVYIYYPSGSTGQVGQPVRACVTNSVNFIPILGVTNSTLVQTATVSVEQSPSSSNPAAWTPDTNLPKQCPTS